MVSNNPNFGDKMKPEKRKPRPEVQKQINQLNKKTVVKPGTPRPQPLPLYKPKHPYRKG